MIRQFLLILSPRFSFPRFHIDHHCGGGLRPTLLTRRDTPSLQRSFASLWGAARTRALGLKPLLIQLPLLVMHLEQP